MQVFFYRSSLFVLILFILLSSCKEKEPIQSSKFTLSDTLLKQLEFTVTDMRTLQNELRFYGKIVADNNKVAQVYSVVGGNISNIYVELGDYVKQGQVLATVLSSEIAEFQKELSDAKSSVALAEKNLQIAKDMFQGKLNSEKDVLAAEKELENAKSELYRINEVYRIYKLKTGSNFNITSPINGFIVAKNINQNVQIRSDVNDILFSIAEISDVWVLANVNESDISKVKLGYKATVKTLSFPDEIYIGTIDKIFNAIDPETKAMKVRILIPNKDFKLKPEMNATISISYNEDQQLLTVPNSSVIFDKSKYWLMIYKNDSSIETRKVEVFRQIGDSTFIKSGLNAGEKVISKNALFIYDALND